MDADGLTFACAMTVEERIARRLGRTALVGLGASRGVPEGRLVSFGIAGALYGLGCGLIADAGLRLYCEYTAPPHVAFAHGGAILGAMFAGVLMAKISAPLSRRRR